LEKFILYSYSIRNNKKEVTQFSNKILILLLLTL
jgi:hypothetical protein